MQAKIITLLLALAVTAFPLPSVAKTLQGKAVHISDGDTLIVMDERHRKYRVRLANIDCPEKRQPWGNKAKRALAGLVGNRLVRVEWGKPTDTGGSLVRCTTTTRTSTECWLLMAIAGCTRATTAMSACPTCSGKLKRPEKGYGASPNTTAFHPGSGAGTTSKEDYHGLRITSAKTFPHK